jgi:hypothetical protein
VAKSVVVWKSVCLSVCLSCCRGRGRKEKRRRKQEGIFELTSINMYICIMMHTTSVEKERTNYSYSFLFEFVENSILIIIIKII